MTAKVKWSIRLKISAVVSVLVMVSLGLYLFVALGLFNSDKSAYIFETTLNTTANLKSHVQTYLLRVLKDSQNLYNLLVDRDLKAEPLRQAALLKELLPKQQYFDLEKFTTTEAKDSKSKDKTKATRAAALEAIKAMRMGGAKDAESWLKKTLPESEDEALELSSMPEEWLYAYGVWMQQAAKLSEAAEAFETLVQHHTKSRFLMGATWRLGEIKFAQREFAAALVRYQASMGIEEPGISSYTAYKIGWTHWLSGRPKDALREFERAYKAAQAPKALKLRLLVDIEDLLVELGDTAALRRILANIADFELRQQRLDARIAKLREQNAAPTKSTSSLEAQRLLRGMFYADPDMVEFSVYAKPGNKLPPQRLLRLVNSAYLKESEQKDSYLDRVDSERPIDFARVKPETPLLANSSLKGGMGLLTLTRQDPLTGRVFVTRLRMDRFLEPFVRNRVYVSFLSDASGSLFAHRDANALVAQKNMLSEAYVQEAVISKINETVREQTGKDGQRRIVAYSGVELFDLYAFAVIKTDKAFQAARELTIKSLYIGISFIAFAILIGMLFAKSLTGPLDLLFRGTQVIAGGNFKERVHIKVRDEIGVLADSFNFMASRIVSLLEQEKDKVRMEEELKVAKLVQDSFFPESRQQVGCLDIAAFYTPSSECGGDWWGLLPTGQRTMFLIGDATGHGVPAALITATAAASMNTVRELAAIHPEILDSPGEILRILNKAVFHAAQGKILMTFFVAVIDTEKMKVTYSNASHNPPYLYRFKDKDPDKKDLKPLQDAVGLRLGHKPDATYTDASSDISVQDVMVMFTDGLVECTNPAKEEYGNRRFIKSILKFAKAKTEDVCKGIMDACMEHYAGHPLADDLTLVCVRVMPKAESAPAPLVVASAAAQEALAAS